MTEQTSSHKLTTDRLLDSKELARHLRVSEAAVHKWVREGRLPVLRLGKSVRFHLPDVMEHFARVTPAGAR